MSWHARSTFPSPALRERVARTKSATGEGARETKCPHPPIAAQWVPPSPAMRERGMRSPCRVKSRILRLEPCRVRLGIAGIVEIERRVHLLDPRPERLAQSGGNPHGGEAAAQGGARR